MGELSNTISTISALLFLASTAVNIYLTMRLSKFENAMNKYIDEKINAVHDSVENDIKDAKADLREQILREADLLNKRIDRVGGHN